MSLALVLISASVQAVDPSPRVLREPVFGLRYERAQAIFEPLPPQVLAKCSTLADNQHSRAVWYVYGKTGDASGRTFYVTGGYEERLDSHSADRRFITDGLGWVLLIDTSTCDPLNPPRDVFNARLPHPYFSDSRSMSSAGSSERSAGLGSCEWNFAISASIPRHFPQNYGLQ